MEVDQRSHDPRNMTYRERLLHLRTQNIVSAEHDVREDTETKLPRIVLKDSLGNRLDTFTVLQEALYRAEWNVKRTKEAKLPEEWRLPRAPLPARPDYSRATPSTFRSKYPQLLRKTDDINVKSEQSSNGKRLHEIDIDDVSFVKQSLNHLPQVPSLAFLRQEFLRDRKDYLQIVGSILLHKRFLSETDKRESIYNFPGFCTGCQRSGLCYGCERSSEPHYHVDGLKLGEAYQLNGNGHIGFLSEDKFADNWRIKFPELTRRNRGRDGSKLSHDSEFLGDERLLLGEDPRGGRKGFAIISNEKLPDLPGLGPFMYENDDQGSSEKDPDRMDIYNQQDLLSDLDKLSRHGTHSDEGRQGEPGHSGQRKQGEGGSQGQNGERTEKPLRVDTAGEDNDTDNDGAILADRDERGSENDMSTSASTGQSMDHEKDSSLQREKSDKSSGHYSQHTSRWTSGTEGYEEEDDEEDDMQEDSATTSSEQKRRRLYKAPQPFKLRQRKQRATQSRSPFSTNRKYDVPTGKAWLPKKSNKKLTEFVEFEHKEVDWKEPKKFTIKHSDKSATQFWSPPPSKNGKKKKTTRRKVQGPPPSPDSGLESEKVQAKTNLKRIKKHLPKQNFTMRLPTILSPSPSINTPSDISLSPILSISREVSLDPAIKYRLPSPKVQAKITSHEKDQKDEVTSKIFNSRENGVKEENASSIMKEGEMMQEQKDLPSAILDMEKIYQTPSNTPQGSFEKLLVNDTCSENYIQNSTSRPDNDEQVSNMMSRSMAITTEPKFDGLRSHSTNDDMGSLIISKYSDISSSPTAVEHYGRNLSTRGSHGGASVDSADEIWPSLKEKSPDAVLSESCVKKIEDKRHKFIEDNKSNRTAEDGSSLTKKSRVVKSSLEMVAEVEKPSATERCRSAISKVGIRIDNNLWSKKKPLSSSLLRQSTSRDSEGHSVSKVDRTKMISYDDNYPHFKGRMSKVPKNEDQFNGHYHNKRNAKIQMKPGKSHGRQKTIAYSKPDRKQVKLREQIDSDCSSESACDEERETSSLDVAKQSCREHSDNKTYSERRSRRDKFLMESAKSGVGNQEFKTTPKYNDNSTQVTGTKTSGQEVISFRTGDEECRSARNEVNNQMKGNDMFMESKISRNRDKDLVESYRSILASNKESERENASRPILLRSMSGAISPIYYEPTFVGCPWADSDPKRVPGRQRPISQEQTTNDNQDAALNQNLESENFVKEDDDSLFQEMLVDDTDDANVVKNEEEEVALDAPRPSPSTPMNEHKFENEEVEEIIDSIKEIPLKTSDLTDLERTASPLSQRAGSPALKHGDLPSKRPVGISPIVEKPQKKEKVKKQKKEVKKPPTPIRSCSPHTPIPLDEEPVVALETQTDVVPPALPELPPIELPPLPEYAEEKEKKEKKKVPHRVSIEPMPKLQEAPPPPSKKSKPVQVPRSKPIQKRKSLVPAEAPVTVDEISHMKDPLDFLAKYCIISLDRLPYYEKVYNKVIVSQPQRYDPPLSPISGLPLKPTRRKERQKEKGEVTLHDMVSVTKGMEPFKVGLNVPEQYLEKLIYTIQICDEKHLDISERLRELEIQKIELLAEKAKQLNPDIAKVEFKLKKTKKKKKKKKSGAVEVEEPVVFSKKDITDEVIVARIDEKMMKKLMKEPDLHHIQCDMERCADRLATLEFRILQMENEKNILDMYCTDVFFTEQLANERPVEFRRQQSNLYNKLHPDPDIEMNIEELESALHTINSTLLTESEFGYLFQVLNLAGRRKINFKLFSVIAALSEKISQMDPVIKDLLNKDDYNALDIKMERSKELFGLLDDGDTAMYGNALASNLAVELTAGGLTPEHTSYVMSKFNREGKGFIDFLDYVMYVPLFIEIHERIIRDPLNAKLVI